MKRSCRNCTDNNPKHKMCQDVTSIVLCKRSACVNSSERPILVHSIISTFMSGFQFFFFFSLTSSSLLRKGCFDVPEVKVTVESQIFILVGA